MKKAACFLAACLLLACLAACQNNSETDNADRLLTKLFTVTEKTELPELTDDALIEAAKPYKMFFASDEAAETMLLENRFLLEPIMLAQEAKVMLKPGKITFENRREGTDKPIIVTWFFSMPVTRVDKDGAATEITISGQAFITDGKVRGFKLDAPWMALISGTKAG